MNQSTSQRSSDDWRAIVTRYQHPEPARAIAQLATTLLPLAALFYLMYRSLSFHYWATLLLAIPAGGLLVRTFIIMHDCAHGSFLPGKRANEIVGWFTGVLTLTPFARWRHGHSLHHASSGDLDRRGNGDVDTLTTREYLALSRMGRLKYRLVRNPLVLFGLGPIHFVLDNRRLATGQPATRKLRFSVWSTNAAIVVLYVGFSLWLGWSVVPLVYGPAMYIAAAAGIWLFYVQHQFEDTYWQEHSTWDYATAAVRGSSYLELPAVLRWFTGSIGVHHVHHLGPRIPNYALKRCHDENSVFHNVTKLTIASSMRTLRLTLWDEARQQLIGFRDIGRQHTAVQS